MLQPLALPPGLSVRQALERVLRLPAVASKRYLTNKVLPVPPQPSAPSPLLTHPRGWLQGSARPQGEAARAGQPP